jgi:hypothetical protein
MALLSQSELSAECDKNYNYMLEMGYWPFFGSFSLSPGMKRCIFVRTCTELV